MFWLPGIALVIAIFFVWFMPKRLISLEMYVTFGMMVALTLGVDVLLNLVFKLYYLGTPKPEWQTYVIEAILPPLCGVICTNFMPSNPRRFVAYLIFVVLLSDAFESLNIYFGYITYRHWNIIYSSVIYLAGTAFLRWQLHFIRSQVNKNRMLNDVP